MNIKSIFLEAFFVVMGVVIAFSANEYREYQNRQEAVSVAIASILNEVETNSQLLASSANYHQNLWDTLSAFSRQNVSKADIRIFNRGFISPASLQSTAWEAAKATNVVRDIPYPIVEAISEIYTGQQSYEAQTRSVGNLIYQSMFNDGTDGILNNYRNLISIISAFSYRERQMTAQYQKAIKTLGESIGNLPAGPGNEG